MIFLESLTKVNDRFSFLTSLVANEIYEHFRVRALSDIEISILKEQGNTADNWNSVFVSALTDGNISLNRIRNCSFLGLLVLGSFEGNVDGIYGVSHMAGLKNCNFYGDCILGDNCYLENCAVIKNMHIGSRVVIVNCNFLVCDNQTSFGNNTILVLGSEAGGRSVAISANTTYADICRRAMLPLDARSVSLNSSVSMEIIATHGIIQDYVRLYNCPLIRNSYIGSAAIVRTV